MKKFIVSMVAAVTLAGTSAAVASSSSSSYALTQEPTEADVQHAIDSRLHAMLVKLNAEKK
jgi:hypothetical protein